jgi:replicative DNA helicase
MRESPESEAAVVGCLLNDPQSFDLINLNDDDFFVAEYRFIFSTIRRMILDGENVDIITVFEKARSLGNKDPDLLAKLNELASSVPGSSLIARYAETVRDRSLLRKAATAFREATESTGSATEILGRLHDRISELVVSTHTGGPVSVREIVTAVASEIQRRKDGVNDRVRTGLIDRALMGGFRKQNLVVLAGRPSMGKTSLAMAIASNVARWGSVLVFSMEMGAHELIERAIASEGRIYSHLMQSPAQMADDGWRRFVDAVASIERMNLWVDDTPAQSAADIRVKCVRHKRKHGLDLVVVDYLGLMSGGTGETRAQEVGSISRAMKALARELDAPVLLLAQLNRDPEKRPDKRPMLSDLRDSGEIEQDADVVMFIHRPEVYMPDDQSLKGYAEVLIRKHRNGPVGEIPLKFAPEFSRFEESEKLPVNVKPKRSAF